MNGLAHRLDTANTIVAETACDLQVQGQEDLTLAQELEAMEADHVIDERERNRMAQIARILMDRGVKTYEMGERLAAGSADIEDVQCDLDYATNTMINGRNAPLRSQAARRAYSQNEYRARAKISEAVKVVPLRARKRRVTAGTNDAA